MFSFAPCQLIDFPLIRQSTCWHVRLQMDGRDCFVCKLCYRVRFWYVSRLLMLSGSDSILVETHPLFCLFGLLVFIPIERIEVGGAGGRQLAAISGDFCSSPHQIEGTEARGTVNRCRACAHRRRQHQRYGILLVNLHTHRTYQM